MFYKKFLLLICSFFLLIPSMVSASGLPDFNPICWTKEGCAEFRAIKYSLPSAEADKGFVEGESPCVGIFGSNPDNVWGKCLPGGQANTTIGIGGKTEFKSIGEYIQTIYNYALGVAGIVAVIVIIVAGIQWIVAGGNQNTIGSSKKRIGGAFIGLFLAYSSYFILNSINPWLVNFRLPESWALRDTSMLPEFCRDIQSLDPPGLPVTLLEKDKTIEDLKGKDIENAPKISKDPRGEFKISSDKPGITMEYLACNKKFVVGNSNETCQGHYCKGEGFNCVKDFGSKEIPYVCKQVLISGSLHASAGTGINYDWDFPFLSSGEGTLIPICHGTGAYKDKFIRSKGNPIGSLGVVNTDHAKETQNFTVGGSLQSAQTACGGGNNLAGFILELNLDESGAFIDESHDIGKGGKDLGEVTLWSRSYLQKASVSDFISLEDLQGGLNLSIDVSKITSVD